jgi:SAM-dependent methyltransferase
MRRAAWTAIRERQLKLITHDESLLSVCAALCDEAAVALVRAAVKAGYHEFFPDALEQIDGMLDGAFDRLGHSQQPAIDPTSLVAVTDDLIQRTFRKRDSAFWFNQTYHHYKTQLKPETDFQQLSRLISGRRVLDYGCGSGYLAARLARAGYELFTTDVLDYRYAEARHLPFVRMAAPTELPYPAGSMDSALVQAVLHHIDPHDLALVIQHLALIATQVLIKEDTYGLPRDLPGVAEALAAQPLLRAFDALSLEAQVRALVLIDYFANVVAQGLPEMNMPFAFKSVTGWQTVLGANGLRVSRTRVVGFEPGRMHQSCHVWFECERSG